MDNNFENIYSRQFQKIAASPNITRSDTICIEAHEAIAKCVQDSGYDTQSLTSNNKKEFRLKYGTNSTKDVDIAIFPKNVPKTQDNLKGMVFFKSVKSSYTKNADNYHNNIFEAVRIAASVKIPILEICLIPTTEKNGTYISNKHYNGYLDIQNTILKPTYPTIKMNIFYFDVNYTTYEVKYNPKKIGVENSVEEAVTKFCEEYLK